MLHYIIKLNSNKKDEPTTQSGEMSTILEQPPSNFIQTIEWHMMDKTKFFPLSMLSSFTVRCALYPLTLIKTRLQIQKHNDMYKGKYTKVEYV